MAPRHGPNFVSRSVKYTGVYQSKRLMNGWRAQFCHSSKVRLGAGGGGGGRGRLPELAAAERQCFWFMCLVSLLVDACSWVTQKGVGC
jgi:hypothetical protein